MYRLPPVGVSLQWNHIIRCFEIWLFYPITVSGSESSFCEHLSDLVQLLGGCSTVTEELRSPSLTFTPNTQMRSTNGIHTGEEWVTEASYSLLQKQQFGKPSSSIAGISSCWQRMLLDEWGPSLGSGSWSIVLPAVGWHSRSWPDQPQGTLCVSLCFFPIPCSTSHLPSVPTPTLRSDRAKPVWGHRWGDSHIKSRQTNYPRSFIIY